MIESRGGWDRCESSASHLNNSPKFYRPIGLRFSLLSKIRKLGQSEDNRKGAAVFRVNTLLGRIRHRVLSSNNKSRFLENR